MLKQNEGTSYSGKRVLNGFWHLISGVSLLAIGWGKLKFVYH